MIDFGGDAAQRLRGHQKGLAGQSTLRLFEADPQRFRRFSWRFEDILVDASKHRIDAETMADLRQLARESDFEAQRRDFFAGAPVNFTEGRAALHMALRYRGAEPRFNAGIDVMDDVRAVLAKMRRFEIDLREGIRTGYSGQRFRNVVHIGIGGSHLGPQLVVRALAEYRHPGLRLHFVADAGGIDLGDVLERLDPATTLFIVASKSFTTPETLANARAARNWLQSAAGANVDVRRHFIALSMSEAAVGEFGIDTTRDMLPLWDWVGGRFSLWSSIGLPIVLALGFERFLELLGGAAAMDQHFLETPAEQNIPLNMALLSLWYVQFWNAETQAIIPYDSRLVDLPAYLQQCEMESNGKRARRDGTLAPFATAPIIWGAVGTEAQHSFFQLWHQGTHLIPGDFWVAALRDGAPCRQQDELLANCFAQTEALMRGARFDHGQDDRRVGSRDENTSLNLSVHRMLPGSQPTTTILYRRLTPRTLGSLLAMYEHKVFSLGALWGLNSFDQWGVELGKALAAVMATEMRHPERSSCHDGSTNGLLEVSLQMRQGDGADV